MDSGENQPSVTPPVPETPSSEPTVTPVTPTPDRPAAGPDGPATEPAKHRYTLDIVIGLLLVALIGGALWYVNQSKPKSAATNVSAKKDIPVLRIASDQPLSKGVYPNMENEDVQLTLNQQVFEGLTSFSDGTKVVPQLATSWTNPDNNTWVFKLRSGVKFHDGTPLTSKQVKASLEQITQFTIGKSFATTIKTVEAVDPLTVKITTNGPDPILVNKLAQLWIWNTDSAKKNDGSTGTGPYSFGTSTDNNVIKLTAVNDYYGGHVYTREVDFTIYDSPEAGQAVLKNKTADLISTRIVPQAGTENGYTRQIVVQNGVSHLVMNTLRKNSPLAKLAVRQALAQATDFKALLASRNLISVSASQIIPAGIPGYDPSIKVTQLDPAAAKDLIVKAGYPKGFSITFTYYAPIQKFAEELKKEYALAGVTLVLDPQTDPKILGKKAFGGGTDMYFITESSNLIDASDIFADFIDTANYSNKDFDTLNVNASSTIDPGKRVAILQEMSRLLVSDQSDIPIYANVNTTLMVAPGIHISQDNLVSTELGTYLWKVYAE